LSLDEANQEGCKRMRLPENGSTQDTQTEAILFIGHATALIRYARFTILTDPICMHKHEQ